MIVIKKITALIIIIAIFIFGTLKVNASTCNNRDLNNLAEQVTGEWKENVKDNVMHFDIIFNNMNEKLYIVIEDDFFGEKVTIHRDKFENSKAILTNKITSTKVTYTGTIYSATDDCMNIALRTVTVNTPIYNHYSYENICAKIPNSKVCQKYIDEVMTMDEFYQAANQYLENPTSDLDEPLVTNPHHNKEECKNITDFEYCQKEIIKIPNEEEFDEALERYKEATKDPQKDPEETPAVYPFAPSKNIKDKIIIGIASFVVVVVVITFIIFKKRKNNESKDLGEMK